jgi:hypothetical protein
MAHPTRVQYPGEFLNLSNDDVADDVFILITTMEDEVQDAALVLGQYEKQRNRWVRGLAEGVRVLGKPGRDATRRLAFIYARYFVYALVAVGNCLNQICSEHYGLVDQIGPIRDSFKRALPALWDIRHSMIHIEDRARGLGRPDRRGRRPKLQPSNSILVLGLLRLDRSMLDCTDADGKMRSIEVSRATLGVAVGALQSAINALPWRGFPHG